MSDIGYVFIGYGLSAAALVGYAWRVVSRGRRLTPLVVKERRRWM